MFELSISMPRSKSNEFYQNRPNIKLFLQKKQCKLFERWGLRLQTPKQPSPMRIFGYAPANKSEYLILPRNNNTMRDLRKRNMI